ncbi:hypothetical protein COW46_01195 [Candidatus Gracilibacteria bacterium CG17_big_fil_post_rev_8_21_14_2_50_48_13]|nr:MAG: hypothetical protein COW46_01195 [Candidatus Gracilibacteria bacterium CG17_big_fil_post_rev_8_21_14_2_50_48_13]
MKKILSLVTLLALLLPTAQAATMRTSLISAMSRAPEVFNDLPSDQANYPAIMFLHEREIVQGYENGSFRPNGLVNRAELVKMVVGMIGGDVSQVGGTNCFPDVQTEWFAPYVCYAKDQGWIGGYPDGTFKPANSVSRVEAMKIVLNAMIASDYWPSPTDFEKSMQMPKDADVKQWYASFLRFAIAKELLDGAHVELDADGAYLYRPGDPMTRKEVAELMFRTYVYMAERVEIANLLGMTMCFQLEHATDDETTAHERWVNSFLADMGYTEAEVDALNTKYKSDDLITDMADAVRESSCGDPSAVDLSRWEGLKIFGL